MKNYIITILGAVAFVCVIVAFAGRSYNSPAAQNITTRAFTTGFQPNPQRDCIVGYTVTITNSPTLLAGSTGQVIIQTSPDNATWTTIMNPQLGFPAGLALSGITGSITIFGLIKAGHWCRIITNNIAGTPSYSTPVGTELSI